jgi:serine/threonine-protein kinase
LGKGGFGVTYLVEDKRVKGKHWALKEIPEMLFDEFEVSLLSALDHPSIPIIADRFTENNLVYLVLKFGGTRTLATECKLKGRIAFANLKPWCIQIGNVLDYLHTRTPPIIHRDFKPENVLLDDDRIMLIDFGIAKESIPESMTRTLGRAASIGFSPPEQIMGTGTDVRSDIYSFAATVYYALTGKIPVPAHERVAGVPLPEPIKFAQDLPVEANNMLLKALNLNINERPQSVKEFVTVFETQQNSLVDDPLAGKTVRLSDFQLGTAIKTDLGRSKPLDSVIAGGDISARDQGKSQKPIWLIAGGSLLIALISGGIFYWTSHKNDSAIVSNVKKIGESDKSEQQTLPKPYAQEPSPILSEPVKQASFNQDNKSPNASSALEILQSSRIPSKETDEPASDVKPTNEVNKTDQDQSPREIKKPSGAIAKTNTNAKTTLSRTAQEEKPVAKSKENNSGWAIIPGETQKIR